MNSDDRLSYSLSSSYKSLVIGATRYKLFGDLFQNHFLFSDDLSVAVDDIFMKVLVNAGSNK